MKVSSKFILSLIIFASICIVGCSVSQQTTSSRNTLTEEDLLELPTIERMMAMQTGHFLMYKAKEEGLRLWKSGDSLCLFSCPVGCPNRDGYWLYQKMYLSSLPDAPLSIDFLKFTKISRDSFMVEQYKGDKAYALADQQTDLLKDVDFKNLESVECPIVFEKKSQLQFKGQTPVCTIDFDGGNTRIYANYFDLTPEGFALHTAYYKKVADKYEHDSDGTCYLKAYQPQISKNSARPRFVK
jgi:hypothetical protein